MRYMLMYTADPDLDSHWGDEAQAALSSWLEDAIRSGTGLQGSGLRPAAEATTIKVRGGEVLITDGPYAETKEQVVGYDLLECASLDEAVRWAGRHPHSWTGAAEVRAVPHAAPATPLPEPDDREIRYMMLARTNPAVAPGEVAGIEPTSTWAAEMNGRGVHVYGGDLAAPDSARTVRVREQRANLADGPFAETKEQISAFVVLDCAGLDEAVQVAAQHPAARFGILELREFRPLGKD